MAGDHFTAALLGNFQLSLADLLQLFSQMELVAVAENMTMIKLDFMNKPGGHTLKYKIESCVYSNPP